MKRLIAIFVLFVMIFPANAQGDKQLTKKSIINLGGGYFAELPEGWTVVEDDDDILYAVDEALEPTYLVTENGTEVVIVSPDSLATAFEEAGDVTTEEAFLIAIEAVYGDTFEPDLIELPLTNHSVAVHIYSNLEGSDFVVGGTYLVDVDNSGSYLLADIYGENSSDAIEESFVFLDSITFDPDAVETQETESEATGEPCFVSTENARTATVRVGPGTNRTALMFLAVGEQFTVTGRFVATDDTVWYQLDKAEVDPTSDAAELWLAQADVDEVGDCDLVGETAAPPIRPILGGGGSSAGGSGGGSAPAGTLPQSGTWTLTLGNRGLVSCLGTNTIEFDTSDVYGNDISDTYSLTSNSSTNTFVMGGQLFSPLPSGAFTGALSFNNGSVGINFYVQNTGFMGGELVYNETIQGLQCSFTIPLSASRN